MVGEELGVLPGMDSISSAVALEGFVGLLGNLIQRKQQHDQFDIIIYDGASPEETLRMIGACSKARFADLLFFIPIRPIESRAHEPQFIC